MRWKKLWNHHLHSMLKIDTKAFRKEKKVDDPSQSARAFYVSSPEPKDQASRRRGWNDCDVLDIPISIDRFEE